MEEKVPYIVHEGEVARLERTIKRLFVIVITAITLLFVSNLLWLYAWCQYDYVGDQTYTYDQDGEGVNIIGTDNEVENGPDVDH